MRFILFGARRHKKMKLISCEKLSKNGICDNHWAELNLNTNVVKCSENTRCRNKNNCCYLCGNRCGFFAQTPEQVLKTISKLIIIKRDL